METVKQSGEYTVFKRRDGRFAVRGKDKKWINGDAKVEILVKEGLLKPQAPKPEAPEAPGEEAAGDGEEADEAG